MFDDDTGYDLNDPKHPDFYERMVGVWDDRDKTEMSRAEHLKEARGEEAWKEAKYGD